MAISRSLPNVDLYETDFYVWSQEQAAALRRLEGSPLARELDIPRLAEEVEDLGKAQRNAARSQLRRIVEHCLKLEYSPAREPRAGWYASIVDARAENEDTLTPTLRRDLEKALERLHGQARNKAAAELAARGELDAAGSITQAAPYRLDDLLDDAWFPVNRHGLGE